MIIKTGKIVSIILFVLIFSGAPARAAGPESLSVSDVSDQLVCQCGCTLILSNCNHAECPSRETMTALIVQELDRGQTSPQIIQTFVTQYGEQVLASPPKKGFNLVAWILPFAVIIAGGVVVYIMLKKWVWRGSLSESLISDDINESFDEYGLRLEQELREFNGKGYR